MFYEIRFPKDISYGAVGGPGFKTEVVVLGSGFESRNERWVDSRSSWDVAKACRDAIACAKLIKFFRLAKGRAHGFRFLDFTDYKVDSSEGVFRPTSADDVLQLQKQYVTPVGTTLRDIQKPYAVTVYDASDNVLQAGVDYTIDITTGLVTALNSPATELDHWAGEFDCAARFDIDRLPLTIEGPEFWRSQNIPIVEIRIET